MVFFRVQDFWCGYKLFCYAYYSHSAQHKAEFRESKLGGSHSAIYWLRLVLLGLCSVSVCCGMLVMLSVFGYLGFSGRLVLCRSACMEPSRAGAIAFATYSSRRLHAVTSRR